MRRGRRAAPAPPDAPACHSLCALPDRTRVAAIQRLHHRIAIGLGEDRGGADRRHAASPAMIASQRAAARQIRQCTGSGCRRSGCASAHTGSASSARRIASSVACRILRQSISSRSAQPTAQRERALADAAAPGARARPGVSCLESRRPRMRPLRIQDHRRGHDRACQRPAAGLINAGDQRAQVACARRHHGPARCGAPAAQLEDRLARRAPAPPQRSARWIAANSLPAVRARAAGPSSCCSSAAAEIRAVAPPPAGTPAPGAGRRAGSAARSIGTLTRPQRCAAERGERR